jgi:hypothetical protein
MSLDYDCLDNLLDNDRKIILSDENGNNEWYINGLLHRSDGPAVEYSNGRADWYCYGVKIFTSELGDPESNENEAESGYY